MVAPCSDKNSNGRRMRSISLDLIALDIVTRENVGFVHALMRMTPEDRNDRQPHRGASGALISADLRIDNRDELLARLEIAPRQAADWSDSRLLLSGWEKLGHAVWPLLRGPFAAAIWDSRSRSLILARDHLGLNVVMWHRSERFFAFASMPNALFALDDVPRELCEEKFADFLVLNHADHATTMYRGVFRVVPAHAVEVKPDGSIQHRRYWSPTDIKPVRHSSDANYADGLRECLDLAVRRQMRSIHPVGSLLSGGLDSSSVSVLAARALSEKNQRLMAFTGVPRPGFDGAVPDGCYADETPYVDAIQRHAGNIDVEYVRNDECSDFAELERFFIALGAPSAKPNQFRLDDCNSSPRTRYAGRRVLLGGLYGNSTISWNGWSQAVNHLRRGRLLLAYRQWRLYYQNTPYSRWVALRKLLIEPVIPARLGNWADRRRHPNRIAAWQEHAPIRTDFAAAMGTDYARPRSGARFSLSHETRRTLEKPDARRLRGRLATQRKRPSAALRYAIQPQTLM